MNNFSANVQWLEGGVWRSGQGRGGISPCISPCIFQWLTHRGTQCHLTPVVSLRQLVKINSRL